MKLTGPGKDRRRSLSVRWEGAGGRGERREVDSAKVEAAIRMVHGIPGAVRAGRDLSLKPGVERS